MKLFTLLTYVKTINRKSSVSSLISNALIDMAINNEKININNLATKANVSPASITSFTKMIGYSSFKSLSADIEKINDSYLYCTANSIHGEKNHNQIYREILEGEKALIERINQNNPLEVYENTINVLDASDDIVFLGNPRPWASFFLDMELSYRGHKCHSYINPIDQKAILEKSKKSTAIIFDFEDDKKTISYLLHEISNIENNIIYFGTNNILRNKEKIITYYIKEENLQDSINACDILLNRIVYFMRNTK